MKKRHFIFILLFIISSVFPVSIFAQMIALSTEELTKSSENVILGEVEKTESNWSEDGKMIITSAKIHINNIIRGNMTNDIIIVEYPGGEIGGIGLKVSDVSKFKEGDEVLLFLNKKDSRDESVFKIVGKAQGHYTIDKNGIAKKGGFSIINNKKSIDNNIHVNKLIEKIRNVK